MAQVLLVPPHAAERSSCLQFELLDGCLSYETATFLKKAHAVELAVIHFVCKTKAPKRVSHAFARS